MKTIAFHSNQLGIRGTEIALYDYAYYNQIILGNKSYILSSINSDLTALNKFQDKFEIFLYDKFEESFKYVKSKNIDHVYYIKGGNYDGKIIPDVKNLIHAVFQEKQIHGDKYAYISKWLAQTMEFGDIYVPHIVKLPPPIKNYRLSLNIPDDYIVIGRYGGYDEFDLPFVHNVIYNVLKKRSNIIFLFMNTRPFGVPHPNIIFLDKTYDLGKKSNFISTCDYMLHARHRGESFGLAICEFLFGGKPVISWKNGLDTNHIELLGDKGVWYNTSNDLFNILLNIPIRSQYPLTDTECSNLIDEFSPENVMNKFENIFLK